MARWGKRASLGVSITAALMLLASVLATNAGAAEPEPEAEPTPQVEVDVDFVGDGSKLWVQVTGCEPGSLVRIALVVPQQEKVSEKDGKSAVLAATVKVSDFAVPEKGPLSTYISLGADETPAEIKVYCWSGGYAEKPIDDTTKPGDVPVIDEDDKPKGEEPKGEEPKGDVPEGDGGEAGGTFDDCKFLSGDALPAGVTGNMFISDQNYRLVVLFWNTELWPRDEVPDVETGQKLTTSSGEKILKIGLCGPGGKPGYTPDALDVFAQKTKDFQNLKLIVSGCPDGHEFTVYYIGDGFEVPEQYWAILRVTDNDEWSGLLSVLPGGWFPESVRVECDNGAMGSANVLLPDGYVAEKEADETEKTEEQEKVVEVVEKKSIEQDRVVISGTIIDKDNGDGTGGPVYQVVAIEPIASDDVATGAVLDDAVERIETAGGTYVAAEQGLTADAVQAVAASPSQQLDLGGFFADVTGSVGLDTDSTTNTLQLALGLLAALGLVAFVGMRRVTRTDAITLI